ncbi:unnamed protein product, partial [marine sediment metagenome]
MGCLIYQKNQFRKLLNKEEVVKNLSNEDIKGLIGFFPKFLQYYGGLLKLKTTDKLIDISKNKKATEIIYLENAIKEFERKINAKTQSEHRWQKFLRDYILIFNSKYTTILDKENISLSIKYPDFLPIDVYGYADVYDIKKPNTPLLCLDNNRKNYYWSAEVSKAISQVENYTDYINKNSYALENKIRNERGIEIRIVKPRGFIIAGKKEQFRNK